MVLALSCSISSHQSGLRYSDVLSDYLSIVRVEGYSFHTHFISGFIFSYNCFLATAMYAKLHVQKVLMHTRITIYLGMKSRH